MPVKPEQLPLRKHIKTSGRDRVVAMILLFCRNEKTIFTERGGTGETVGNVNEATIIKYISEPYERDRLTGDSVK